MDTGSSLYVAERSFPFDFYGPQTALALRLDAILQGSKSLDFQGPTPLSLALVPGNGFVRIKSITYGAVPYKS
jgi:hypothetical protein